MRVYVYPVGILAALRSLLKAYRSDANKRFDPEYRDRVRQWARSRVRQELRTLGRRIRCRQWRDAKNSFNGYLAEPTPFPEHLRRCGSGWTRHRALRSLQRHARRPGVPWDAICNACDKALHR